MIDTNDQVKFCSYCGVFLLSRDGKYCFACGSLIKFTKDDELEHNIGIESDPSHDKIAMKKLEIADKIARKKEEFAVKKVKFAEKMELKKVDFAKKIAKKKEEFKKKKEDIFRRFKNE